MALKYQVTTQAQPTLSEAKTRNSANLGKKLSEGQYSFAYGVVATDRGQWLGIYAAYNMQGNVADGLMELMRGQNEQQGRTKAKEYRVQSGLSFTSAMYRPDGTLVVENRITDDIVPTVMLIGRPGSESFRASLADHWPGTRRGDHRTYTYATTAGVVLGFYSAKETKNYGNDLLGNIARHVVDIDTGGYAQIWHPDYKSTKGKQFQSAAVPQGVRAPRSLGTCAQRLFVTAAVAGLIGLPVIGGAWWYYSRQQQPSTPAIEGFAAMQSGTSSEGAQQDLTPESAAAGEGQSGDGNTCVITTDPTPDGKHLGATVRYEPNREEKARGVGYGIPETTRVTILKRVGDYYLIDPKDIEHVEGQPNWAGPAYVAKAVCL